MTPPIFRSASITELHQNMGLETPLHPLICVIDTAMLEYGEEFIGMRFTTDMYCIAFKDGGCSVDYGMKAYDFSDGNLFFSAPEQVYTVTSAQKKEQVQGWMLYFHPELIHQFPLGKLIDEYRFFNYETSSALKLEATEESQLQSIVRMLEQELSRPRDEQSDSILVTTLELLLNHCARYYARQQVCEKSQRLDVLAKVESALKDFYQQQDMSQVGQPSIQYLAEQCHLSANYLSDVLTKQTGRSAKEHINDFLIEKAKHLLKSGSDPISQIAFTLGFNYPHYFTRLFKQKTGKTPQEYRQT